MNPDSLRPKAGDAAWTSEVPTDTRPGSIDTTPPPDSWQTELLESYTTVDDLLRAGILDEAEAHHGRASGARDASGARPRFRVRLPRYYASLMDLTPEGRATCPIRRQAVPSLLEEDPVLPPWAVEWSRLAFGRDTPWTADAIGDIDRLAAPRITHRYDNRAIVHVSSLCALYCRFCFRKEHLNERSRELYEGTLDPAIDYIREHPEIREVILTGGDPLSMTDAWLRRFFERLADIPHIRAARIHSRMAATLPSRLTDSLAAVLTLFPFPVSLVSHFNHPRELSPSALARLGALRRRGVPLYNQSVLLAGVNDDIDTLRALFQGLYEAGVSPFYLHHADWTPHTFGFRVPIETGRALMRELEGRVSGPALPRYVLDIPGGHGKTSLMDDRVRRVDHRIDGTLCGALYTVQAPRTRGVAKSPLHHAELWRPATANRP